MLWLIIILAITFVIFFMMLYDICNEKERKVVLTGLCIVTLFALFTFIGIYFA